MNVSLTPQLEEMINQKLETGLYQSASEVVRAALRLFEQQERTREQRLEELRREIAIGIKAADEGRTSPFDEAAVERIIARGQELLAKGNRRERT